jgi:hypothetical protein
MNQKQAIEYLEGRKDPADMSIEAAIVLVASRRGRPEDWDLDVLAAAEVLAIAVDNLQWEKEAARLGI